jgi:UDP-N-acetyl-D-mannosaminuronic acid dehydrogenase
MRDVSITREGRAAEPLGAVAVIGGAGHVGLPLGLSFAAAGRKVILFDINEKAIAGLREGRVPFLEEGGTELLRAQLGNNLSVSSDPQCLSTVENVICVIGTPIDEHLNPKVDALLSAVDGIREHLKPSQLFVLRSTVFPGATEKVHEHLSKHVPARTMIRKQ